jgi:chromosomal replication initiation ATPase DnaA
LQRPDFEARLGFLEAEIKDNPLKLTGEILRRIAGTVSGPYTELAGALNSLLAYSQALEITLTPEAAEKVLQDLKFAPVEQPLSIIQN